MNKVILRAYSGTTALSNTGLENAQGVAFSSVYPGGLYERMSCFVPFDTSKLWVVRPGVKIIARNAGNIVWEGWITSINRAMRSEQQGFDVTAAGAWYYYLMSRKWRKPWADTRIEQNVFVEPGTGFYSTDVTDDQKCTIDRKNRIRFTPKAVSWASNEFARVVYTAPTGETIKRITLNWELQESTQSWIIAIYDQISETNLVTQTTSGTGSWDVTPGTPTQIIWLTFGAHPVAPQTPASNGTIFGQFTNVVVYTETGSINLTEIATDCAAHVTELSADVSRIGSNTLSLVPFISETDSVADILTRAASYGDSSNNTWAVYVDSSQWASDSKPILVVEQQPALTSTDYRIRLDEENIEGEISINEDVENIKNWVAVKYRDDEGKTQYVTPDDDGDLEDAASIALYGERHEWLSSQSTSLTLVTEYGKRYLAAHKDLQYMITDGITVKGYLRTTGNGRRDVSQVRAGERIKVENVVTATGETSLTYLISRVEYSDDNRTIRLTLGLPDDFSTWLARIQREIDQSGT